MSVTRPTSEATLHRMQAEAEHSEKLIKQAEEQGNESVASQFSCRHCWEEWYTANLAG